MNGVVTRGPAGESHRRLLEAAQQGDRAAQEELLRRYEPLVRRVVWRLRPPPGCERDDLAQEARIGLIAAIRAWQSGRGPFPAFADRCVRNQALLAIQAAARHKHQLLSRAVSLDGAQGDDATGTGDSARLPMLDALPVHDPRSDPEARLLVNEQLRSVLRALPTLTQSERRALAGALAGESYEQLASTVGGTPKAISQAVGRARSKLAGAMPRAA